jgi:hypothetical protein
MLVSLHDKQVKFEQDLRTINCATIIKYSTKMYAFVMHNTHRCELVVRILHSCHFKNNDFESKRNAYKH